MIGGYRRWFSEEPPGKSSGRLRQKLLPACTSLTPSRTFSDVIRLIRPSSSSSPQSPHVEPSGRRAHRFATADPPHFFVLSGQNKANSPARRRASPDLARFRGGEGSQPRPFIMTVHCHRTVAAGCPPPAASGLREGHPLGGDHERELAGEEVRFVGPRPGVGLGGGACPHRGD